MNLKKVLIIISIVVLVMSLIVFGILAYINAISTNEKDINHNNKISRKLEQAICCYLVETEDFKLTFGGKSTKSVGDIIITLEKMEYIKLESYEPIKHRFFGFFKVGNLGWKIVVNKERYQASVSVSKKDEIIFTE